MRHLLSKEEFQGFLNRELEVSEAAECFYEGNRFYRNNCYLLFKNAAGANVTMIRPIPRGFLDEILDIFRKRLPNEALVRIYWDGEKFILDEPEIDRVSPVYISTCHAEKDKGLLVLEMHSHDTMRAFWSVTDDKDEVFPGIYGVMGNVDTDEPSLLLRIVYDGEKQAVAANRIFS